LILYFVADAMTQETDLAPAQVASHSVLAPALGDVQTGRRSNTHCRRHTILEGQGGAT
jgi:hypothetical protein